MDLPPANSPHCALTYVREALEDAERLMKFAAETGVDVDKKTRESVIEARSKIDTGIDEITVENLLEALTRLTQLVAPVTPESILACATTRARPPYRKRAIFLAVFIIAYSTVSFVTSAIATSIRGDITTANGLAVILNAQFASPTSLPASSSGAAASPSEKSPPSTPWLSPRVSPGMVSFNTPQRQGCPPPADVYKVYFDDQVQLPAATSEASTAHTDDVVKNFQEYAAAIRRIDAHTRELSLYVHLYKYLFDPASMDAFHRIRNCPIDLNRVFELQLPLTNYSQEVVRRTRIYQLARFYAQSTTDDVAFYYGAVSACVLPVLYALLGAVAYTLKNFEQRIHARTYVPSRADSARFIIAAIGGMVVGLFSNFPTLEGVKASPLALAFLVGYAVDVFYAFLATLLQSFTKTAMAASGASASSGGKSGAPPQSVNRTRVEQTTSDVRSGGADDNSSGDKET